jgi:ABC-type branched-subunit amino acid transport system substrate-binding protein
MPISQQMKQRSPMRTPRAVALIITAVLLAGACGARLPETVRQSAANADLGGNGSALTPDGGTSPGATSANSGSGTPSVQITSGGSKGTKGSKGSSGTGPQGGSPGSSGGKPGSSTGGGGKKPSNPTASGEACPTGGTDVGETSSTINLGTIADVTGPVPGLFTGAQEGMGAFVAYINSNGGLCGHRVTDDFADGETSCQANESATQNLVKKDFALVGTFSLYDNCGATVLKANPTVPDIHVALDPAAEPLANHFDLEPGALGYATGMWKYYAGKLGKSVIGSVGTISENIPSAVAKQNAELKAAKTAGFKFTYSDNAAPTTSDFESDFTKMCGQDHVKAFFTVTEDAQNAATMISDENKVSACKGIVNIIPIAYDQSFLTFCKQVGCGSTTNSIQGWNEYSLFFNSNESANIPELKLFQSWFSRANPGKPLNLYALFAWADARLFQQAYETAGTTATRNTVLAALGKIKNYSDDGVMAPTNPGSKTTGNECWINWKLTNGVFSRQGDPSTSYNCGSFETY